MQPTKHQTDTTDTVTFLPTMSSWSQVYQELPDSFEFDWHSSLFRIDLFPRFCAFLWRCCFWCLVDLWELKVGDVKTSSVICAGSLGKIIHLSSWDGSLCWYQGEYPRFTKSWNNLACDPIDPPKLPGPSIQVCTSFAMLVGWYPPGLVKNQSSGGFCWSFKTWQQLDVSKNSGTLKSSILIGFSIINHPFWGTPIFGNTHMATSGATLVWLHMLRVCIAEVQVEWISWCSLSLFCVPPATKLPVDINLIQFEYRCLYESLGRKLGKQSQHVWLFLHIRSLLPTPSPCERRFFLNDQRYVFEGTPYEAA